MSFKCRCCIPLLLAVVFGIADSTPLAVAQAVSSKVADGSAQGGGDISNEPVHANPAPVSGDFKLGVGDVIHVSVWREPELTQTAVIRPDGKISIPLAGEIPVAGKTTLSAQSHIHDLLLKYVTDPEVTVSVIEIHSRQVFITGQVQRPGAYPLLGSCSVLQLIASAGGLTPYAHKKDIVILDAASRSMGHFNYSRAVKGNSRQERMLQPGDTVVVP